MKTNLLLDSLSLSNIDVLSSEQVSMIKGGCGRTRRPKCRVRRPRCYRRRSNSCSSKSSSSSSSSVCKPPVVIVGGN